MNIVVTGLAGLFALVAIARLPSVIRQREARASYITTCFATLALLLLNMDLVHFLIREFPWAAGAVRVSPFIFGVISLWFLGEAAAQGADPDTYKRSSIWAPALWCAAIVIVFLFVKLDPLVEPFTVTHSQQFAGLAYTLIYYTAAGWCTARITVRASRAFRAGSRGPGYVLLAVGGLLMSAACALQYALLVPVYLGSEAPQELHQLFNLLFFPGALLVVTALQLFPLSRRTRPLRLTRMAARLRGILTTRGLPATDGSAHAGDDGEAYEVYALLVRIEDFSTQGRLTLTDREQKQVRTARRWVSRSLPTLTDLSAYSTTAQH